MLLSMPVLKFEIHPYFSRAFWFIEQTSSKFCNLHLVCLASIILTSSWLFPHLIRHLGLGSCYELFYHRKNHINRSCLQFYRSSVRQLLVLIGSTIQPLEYLTAVIAHAWKLCLADYSSTRLLKLRPNPHRDFPENRTINLNQLVAYKVKNVVSLRVDSIWAPAKGVLNAVVGSPSLLFPPHLLRLQLHI